MVVFDTNPVVLLSENESEVASLSVYPNSIYLSHFGGVVAT